MASELDVFHDVTALNDLLPRYESTLRHGVELYEANDLHGSVLAIYDMAQQLSVMSPRITQPVALSVARFMVERLAQERKELIEAQAETQ